jgi:hypothetical protein
MRGQAVSKKGLAINDRLQRKLQSKQHTHSNVVTREAVFCGNSITISFPNDGLE